MSEVTQKQSKSEHLGRTILDIPRRITEPSNTIIDEVTRRKARFLSMTLFLGVMIFPILQITNNTNQEIPYYSGSALLLAFLYLLGKTEHIRLTIILSILFIALLPFVLLLTNPVWTSYSLAHQLLSWPVLAVLIGSQLLTKKKEAVLIISMNLGLIFVCILHPGIVILFLDAAELIAVSIAIQTLLWFASWTVEYYTTKIEQSKRALEIRGRELEIYTSLLRHDLANDIQMVLGCLELSQMTEDDPKRHASFLVSTLAAADRMKSLIHMFSVTEGELGDDIVTVLNQISKRAQIGFKGMTVTLDIEDEVLNQPVSYGKLTALAFENLLRNSAQYAGDKPVVQIKISRTQDHLEIIFEDDGPGVAEKIRDQLFVKGVTTGKEGRGVGLYLTKKIIELEGGSIQLITNERPGCCFEIHLPLQ